MPDDPSERKNVPEEEPKYEAPDAEELPESDTLGVASGPGTQSDSGV